MKSYKFRTVIILVLSASSLLLSFMPCKQKKTMSKNWINVNYVKCLKKKLPCECEKIVKTYFTITLDTNESSKFFGGLFLKYNENEYDQWDLKKESKNNYKIYRAVGESTNILGHLTLKNDTLYLTNGNNEKSIFINYGNEDGDEKQYTKQNIFLLNNAFINRGYLSLERILDQDSLNCSCNKELGKINLISVDKRSKAWIIEQSKDSVFIYNILNSSDDKTISPKLTKQLFRSFKWK